MSSSGAAAAKPGKPGPLGLVLAPVRGQLMAAAALAAVGTMLTLVPLAGIAHIARIVLAGAEPSATAQAWPGIWWTVVASLACMFAGMALISAGELTAHLADNRLTHRLRLAAAQRL